MHVLLDLQSRTLLLHLHTDHDVQVFSLRSSLLIVLAVLIELRSIGILHIVASVMTITLFIHTLLNEVIVEFVHHIVLTLKVYHRTGLTFLIYKEETWYMGVLCDLGVVGTEGWSDMHDTSTILCGHIVARNHAECLALHLHELILAILTCEDLLRMSLSVCLHIVGSILVEFG